MLHWISTGVTEALDALPPGRGLGLVVQDIMPFVIFVMRND